MAAGHHGSDIQIGGGDGGDSGCGKPPDQIPFSEFCLTSRCYNSKRGMLRSNATETGATVLFAMSLWLGLRSRTVFRRGQSPGQLSRPAFKFKRGVRFNLEAI